MKLTTSFVGGALVLLLAAGSAWAQAQDRASGGGGQAVDRASGGGTAPIGGTASGGSAGPVGGGAAGGGDGGGRGVSGGGDFATPRGVPGSRESHDTRSVSKFERALEAAQTRHAGSDARGDFQYSRSRGDQPVVGQAVPRESVAVTPRDGTVRGYWNPYDYGYGYGYGSWLWGGRYSRYGYYDPFYGYYPYGYGAFGLGYFYYDPYYWSAPSAPYSSSYQGAHGFRYIGTVRLKVKPRDAEVWVDGYYAGLVDDFDGIFQHLHLDAGPHRIEIRAAGYETLALDVRVQPERSLTISQELQKQP